MQTIHDAAGRSVTIPEKIDRLICSGPGCLRLITYFNAQSNVVAVDDIEVRQKAFDARPYALTNPEYRRLPVFGGFRGNDDPEKILGLANPPQVIFKAYATMGYDPEELQAKTRIPVIVLQYGDLWKGQAHFFNSLRLIGQALGKQERAEALIDFFTREIEQLEARTLDVKDRKSCFIGGIAFKGPHGFQSTEPSYPPFYFVKAKNIAATPRSGQTSLQHSNFSKEKLLMENPDILFVDLSTLQMGEHHSGLAELKTDPVFTSLSAVQEKRVYGVLPYNWYTQNFGSILADAWYIGKILYPERFTDIDPAENADRIYRFLLQRPVFEKMDSLFMGMVFRPALSAE